MLLKSRIGVGIGTLVGGSVAQYFGFHQAFMWAWLVNLLGLAFYFLYSRSHYLRNRLNG
ncbi:MAG: hypothetical protein LUD17_08135 [Bacteroidales bacterium]|nr:hypothetical protein [Bacteroidales bacterium]